MATNSYNLNRQRDRGYAPSESSLRRVKSMKLWVPDEQGHQTQRDVTLWLDARGVPAFGFKIPEYMRAPLDCGEFVSAVTAAAAEKQFLALCERYVSWVKSACAELVLIISAGERARPFFDNQKADRTQQVELSYRRAFRVNGQLFSIEEEHERAPLDPDIDWTGIARHTGRVFERPGHRMNDHITDGCVLLYTPELHAKLDQIIDALKQAASTLHDLLAAPDATAALLAFGSAMQPALPAPTRRRKIEL